MRVFLDFELADPDVSKTLGSLAPSDQVRARERAHDRELDEMIRMGWGGTDQDRIPADWRTRRGPEPAQDRRRGRGLADAYHARSRARSIDYKRAGRSKS